MPKQDYNDSLKQNFGEIIEKLTLSDLQKQFIKSRWLDQVLWMEGKANGDRVKYYISRLIAIVGGVIIPALVSLSVVGEIATAIKWGTFGLSLLVAVSVAIEEFFHFGDRWKHYRRTVECMKIEGWQFFQLSSPYQGSHAEAYPVFAGRVESIIQRDVEVYITEVVKEKMEKKGQNTSEQR